MTNRSHLSTLLRFSFLASALAATAVPAGAQAPAAGRPASPPARTAAAPVVDQLRQVVRWEPEVAADDPNAPARSYTVTLPPQLERAIAAVVPGYRLRDPQTFLYAPTHNPRHPQATRTIVVADLDRDHVAEAVLLVAPPGADTLDLVLGVRQTPAGFEVRVLGTFPLERAGLPEEGQAPPPTVVELSYHLLSRTGKGVAGGMVPWVRYQDPDCKSMAAVQWTIKQGRWVRSASDCTWE